MRPIYITILLSITILSCTPKFSPYLEETQALNYTTNWSKIENYPVKYGRSDDLHFFDKNTGFVINSEGYLSYTENGGDSWEIVHENKGTFFRCIEFKNRQEGWLGTIGTDDPYLTSKDTVAMYETKDGGLTWTPVQFIGPNPKGLCGLQKVNEKLIVGCGRVRGPSYFIKTIDGGKTWTSQNLDHVAGSLIAAHFFDQEHGFLIGGTTRDKDNSKSMVLETKDGGSTWDTTYMSTQIGEYPWKFSFPTREHGFISIQRNVKNGDYYHLETTDGGTTWKEVVHSKDYYYVQGIGFANEQIGFMGGSSGKTYQTRNSGQTWEPYTNIGNGFNNFQFFPDGSGYGVGYGVFKCNDVNSEPTLLETYYDNGKLESTQNIMDGKRNGPAKSFYEDEKIKSTGRYEQNLKVGKWEYYNKDGTLDERTKMKNGSAKLSKKKLRKFEGTYSDDSGASGTISLKDNILFSLDPNGKSLPIFPEMSDQFYFPSNSNLKFKFHKDKNGTVTGATFIRNGEETKLTRNKESK